MHFQHLLQNLSPLQSHSPMQSRSRLMRPELTWPLHSFSVVPCNYCCMNVSQRDTLRAVRTQGPSFYSLSKWTVFYYLPGYMWSSTSNFISVSPMVWPPIETPPTQTRIHLYYIDLMSWAWWVYLRSVHGAGYKFEEKTCACCKKLTNPGFYRRQTGLLHVECVQGPWSACLAESAQPQPFRKIMSLVLAFFYWASFLF